MADDFAVKVVWLGELVMWAEATAPVTTRDRAKARRRFFMVSSLSGVVLKLGLLNSVLDKPDVVTI
jgi:hypothetical protein